MSWGFEAVARSMPAEPTAMLGKRFTGACFLNEYMSLKSLMVQIPYLDYNDIIPYLDYNHIIR